VTYFTPDTFGLAPWVTKSQINQTLVHVFFHQEMSCGCWLLWDCDPEHV